MTAVTVKIQLSEVTAEQRAGIQDAVTVAIKSQGLKLFAVNGLNESGVADLQFAYDKKGIIVEAETSKKSRKSK